MADGGKTPIRSAKELEDMVYSMAIYPAMTGLAAAQAAFNALSAFKELGTSVTPAQELYSFADFNQLIGFPEVWEFERRWARQSNEG